MDDPKALKIGIVVALLWIVFAIVLVVTDDDTPTEFSGTRPEVDIERSEADDVRDEREDVRAELAALREERDAARRAIEDLTLLVDEYWGHCRTLIYEPDVYPRSWVERGLNDSLRFIQDHIYSNQELFAGFDGIINDSWEICNGLLHQYPDDVALVEDEILGLMRQMRAAIPTVG